MRKGRSLAPSPGGVRGQPATTPSLLSIPNQQNPAAETLDFDRLYDETEVEVEEVSRPRRAIRLGINLVWILGAILITVLQMCRGG